MGLECAAYTAASNATDYTQNEWVNEHVTDKGVTEWLLNTLQIGLQKVAVEFLQNTIWTVDEIHECLNIGFEATNVANVGLQVFDELSLLGLDFVKFSDDTSTFSRHLILEVN